MSTDETALLHMPSWHTIKQKITVANTDIVAICLCFYVNIFHAAVPSDQTHHVCLALKTCMAFFFSWQHANMQHTPIKKKASEN
jgi:hypothetical protein